MLKRLFPIVLLSLLIGISPGASAEIVVGVDTISLEYQLRISPANEFYDLSPNRVRVAYMNDSIGIEAHLYQDADDRIIDYFGDPFEFKMEDTIGLFLRVESSEKWVFGTIGAIRTKATYGFADLGPYDVDTVLLFGGSLGMQYVLANHVRFSVEYDFYTGDINLPENLVSGPGLTTKPNSYYKGFAAGISFSF